MASHELGLLLNNEAGLWLAAIAACAGLALGWRLWMARRRLRNRALRVLGYVKPTDPGLANGMRYACVITAAILTILVLTPAVPGAGDVEPTTTEATTSSPEITPAVVIVELHADGATIIMKGNIVEIRVATDQLTPVATAVGNRFGEDIAVPSATATRPVSILPEGME